MKLVLATSIIPDGRQTSGNEIATAAILDSLRRAGVEVVVVGFRWPDSTPEDPDRTIVLGAVDVKTATASLGTKLRWLAKAVRSNLTFASAKLREMTPESLRETLAGLEPYDGYVLNSVQLAGAFEDCFRNKPTMFLAQNVEHVTARENAAASRSFVQRLLFLREAALLEKLEQRLCSSARFVFTLSEEDRVALGVEDDRSVTLPLVARRAPDAPAARPVLYDAALIGTWTWQPNRIGLDWFLEKVVPFLPADFSVRIAGSVPDDVSVDRPNIQFVGRVPDAVEFVRGAAMIPLISTSGSGVQLKTIETFELGLPSVATRHSLRGVDYLPPNCHVTDDPREFANAMVATAKSPQLVDGREFYARQKRLLDARVRQGLDAMDGTLLERVA
ncbi:MAG: glycosyltransferase [Rhizobiaceae bacterium]|nr:glycosyltransferase [Rhizobiaceae bacterium]